MDHRLQRRRNRRLWDRHGNRELLLVRVLWSVMSNPRLLRDIFEDEMFQGELARKAALENEPEQDEPEFDIEPEP